MKPQGIRTCGECGKIRGHNARTCKRLQLEEQLRKQQLELNTEQKSANSTPKQHKKGAKEKDDTQPENQIRRSSRFKKS